MSSPMDVVVVFPTGVSSPASIIVGSGGRRFSDTGTSIRDTLSDP